MKLNWLKNKIFIAGALILVTAIVLVVVFNNSASDTSKVKGTIVNTFFPAVGDAGTVLGIVGEPSSPGHGLAVHFDKDSNTNGSVFCVKFDDDHEAEVGGRVRCIQAVTPPQVTNE